MRPETPPVLSYENSSWRTEFWPGRDYEDLAERIAIRRMLPPRGARLVEIGAGFGRLAEFYRGYERIVLLDYARTMLAQAREKLLGDPRLAPYAARFALAVGDLYNLPLADSAVDTAVTVRVLHHVADIPRAFAEIARSVRPEGSYLLEHANKRHLKAILRYGLLRRGPNPFALEPYEFVKLNFDFHPHYIEEQLRAADFSVQERRAVSTWRLAALKRIVPAHVLASLDGALQAPLSPLQVSPSIFLRAYSSKPGAPALNPALWRDPACGSMDIAETDAALTCRACGRVYPIVDGIIDFKRAL